MNNVYGSEDVPTNTPTIIAGLTVPARSGYSLKGFIAWSDVDCDLNVKINIAMIGGGRINAAQQTLAVDWSSSPYGLVAGDVVSVTATQTDQNSHVVHCTILVEQL